MLNDLVQPEMLSAVLAMVQDARGAAGEAAGAVMPPVEDASERLWWTGLILWLPLASAFLCGLCAAMRVRNKLPAWITVALLGASFVLTLLLYMSYDPGHPQRVHLFDWFNIRWGEGGDRSFVANFALYIDSLTLLWMLFVTGLGTLIALYAAEYMENDVKGAGYARFFAGVSIFLFAMTALVMADNLLLLYLGWEGVGFASYYLIGYYYRRPSAVAAAKKAFIVNRIGDLGLALGIYLIYHNFGTLDFAKVFHILASPGYSEHAGGWSIQVIPYLLMLGAFGKSAQIPLYVWLPDAMEGPTPVSALIHAATMVTAGVYLICRMIPVMELHPYALDTVAWIGALTALLAATIAMAQYDFKRIWAYSTISQLGYMFAGAGMLSTTGAAYHVFTHSFFKAVLFLSAGAIMHGFAGQLDLRKVSGLCHLPGWRITAWTMFYACLCLVGFPIISSGFWSKDAIMAQAFLGHGPGFTALGAVLVMTALLTAYYAFRVWFRVCAGPVQHEMGDEHHGDDEASAHVAHQPHAPGIIINGVLVVISIGAIASIFLKDWAGELVLDSSAVGGTVTEHDTESAGFWSNAHAWMPWVAGATTMVGMAIAWWFHLAKREAADALRAKLLARSLTRWLPTAMENKWYVDEIYHRLIRAPMWGLGHAAALFDRLVIDGLLVNVVGGRTPRWLGRVFQPLQNGILQDYAKTMAGAAALVILFVWLMKSGAMNWVLASGGGG